MNTNGHNIETITIKDSGEDVIQLRNGILIVITDDLAQFYTDRDYQLNLQPYEEVDIC